MNKFKKGDTVYLKAVYDKPHTRGEYEREIVFFDEMSGEFFLKESLLLTKQEMLDELNKPELPKVGEVYIFDGYEYIVKEVEEKHIDVNKIVETTVEKTFFLENYEKVSAPQTSKLDHAINIIKDFPVYENPMAKQYKKDALEDLLND